MDTETKAMLTQILSGMQAMKEDLQGQMQTMQGQMQDMQGQMQDMQGQMQDVTNRLRVLEGEVQSTKEQVQEVKVVLGTRMEVMKADLLSQIKEVAKDITCGSVLMQKELETHFNRRTQQIYSMIEECTDKQLQPVKEEQKELKIDHKATRKRVIKLEKQVKEIHEEIAKEA